MNSMSESESLLLKLHWNPIPIRLLKPVNQNETRGKTNWKERNRQSLTQKYTQRTTIVVHVVVGYSCSEHGWGYRQRWEPEMMSRCPSTGNSLFLSCDLEEACLSDSTEMFVSCLAWLVSGEERRWLRHHLRNIRKSKVKIRKQIMMREECAGDQEVPLPPSSLVYDHEDCPLLNCLIKTLSSSEIHLRASCIPLG